MTRESELAAALRSLLDMKMPLGAYDDEHAMAAAILAALPPDWCGHEVPSETTLIAGVRRRLDPGWWDEGPDIKQARKVAGIGPEDAHAFREGYIAGMHEQQADTRLALSAICPHDPERVATGEAIVLVQDMHRWVHEVRKRRTGPTGGGESLDPCMWCERVETALDAAALDAGSAERGSET